MCLKYSLIFLVKAHRKSIEGLFNKNGILGSLEAADIKRAYNVCPFVVIISDMHSGGEFTVLFFKAFNSYVDLILVLCS